MPTTVTPGADMYKPAADTTPVVLDADQQAQTIQLWQAFHTLSKDPNDAAALKQIKDILSKVPYNVRLQMMRYVKVWDEEWVAHEKYRASTRNAEPGLGPGEYVPGISDSTTQKANAVSEREARQRLANKLSRVDDALALYFSFVEDGPVEHLALEMQLAKEGRLMWPSQPEWKEFAQDNAHKARILEQKLTQAGYPALTETAPVELTNTAREHLDDLWAAVRYLEGAGGNDSPFKSVDEAQAKIREIFAKVPYAQRLQLLRMVTLALKTAREKNQALPEKVLWDNLKADKINGVSESEALYYFSSTVGASSGNESGRVTYLLMIEGAPPQRLAYQLALFEERGRELKLRPSTAVETQLASLKTQVNTAIAKNPTGGNTPVVADAKQPDPGVQKPTQPSNNPIFGITPAVGNSQFKSQPPVYRSMGGRIYVQPPSLAPSGMGVQPQGGGNPGFPSLTVPPATTNPFTPMSPMQPAGYKPAVMPGNKPVVGGIVL